MGSDDRRPLQAVCPLAVWGSHTEAGVVLVSLSINAREMAMMRHPIAVGAKVNGLVSWEKYPGGAKSGLNIGARSMVSTSIGVDARPMTKVSRGTQLPVIEVIIHSASGMLARWPAKRMNARTAPVR